MSFKSVYFPTFDNVVITEDKLKKTATLPDCSFLVTATGVSEQEAIENLKEAYKKIFDRLDNSD